MTNGCLKLTFKQKGFTLIELIMAMSLTAIIALLLTQLLISNNNIFYDQTNQVQQGIGLNNSISKVSNDIKSAISVAAGYPVASPTVSSDASHMVLQLPAIDANKNTIDGVYDYVVVSADSSNSNILREKIYPDATSTRSPGNLVLASNLVSISFSYYDNSGNSVTPTAASRINFSITLNVSTQSNLTPQSANATVNLRNN